ncbi:MAG TPA: hypothetical protein VF733_00800 [Candidatus Saccharimonadales bacterium]
MAPGFCYSEYNINSSDKSRGRLDLRAQGAYITRFALSNKDGEMIPIFHEPIDLWAADLAATHVMCPVGPSKGPGGEHGFARWADYEATTEVADTKHAQAIVPAKEVQIGISAGVYTVYGDPEDSSELGMGVTITNPLRRPIKTSLGHQLYFALPHEDATGLRVGEHSHSLAEPAKLDEIMSGKPQFWPHYDGYAVIELPKGPRLEMRSRIYAGQNGDDYKEVPRGMLLWHRPGTESICLSPTLGYEDDGKGTIRNDLLHLAAEHFMTLETDIRLMS